MVEDIRPALDERVRTGVGRDVFDVVADASACRVLGVEQRRLVTASGRRKLVIRC